VNAIDDTYSIEELRVLGQPWFLHCDAKGGGCSAIVECDGCGEVASMILPTLALCDGCRERDAGEFVVDAVTRRERVDLWEREALVAQTNGVVVQRRPELDAAIGAYARRAVQRFLDEVLS
jgi:hypothetical protein